MGTTRTRTGGRRPCCTIRYPQTRRIVVLTPEGGAYREHGTFEAGSVATSVLLDGFTVAVDEVFAAGDQA